MKIAFLTPEYPHSRTGVSGGIGTSIFNLSKGLVQHGHKVSVIIYGQDIDEVFEDNEVVFYKVKNIKIKGFSFFLTQKKVQILINKLVLENKIDIVEAPDWTGFSAFIQLKCPLIIREHGSDTYFCHLDKRPVKCTNKFLEKRALQKCNGIIAVSEFTGKLTKELFQLNRNFTVIPNAIDVTQFKETSSHTNSETILYFGTLIRKKGLLELPLIFNKVVKKNPNAKLILVGKDAFDIATKNDSTWQLMVPLFDKIAFEKVSYIGSISYTEIQKIIQEATICVFPSFAEALPVSWLEAMATKKAIVASNIGWASEIIDDGIDGFLEDPKNHQEFASKIVTLLNNEGLRKSFGMNAIKKIKEKFDLNLISELNIVFYNSIISNTKKQK